MVYPVKGFYLQIHDQEQILVQAVAVVVPAGSSGRARTRRLAILSMVRMNESNFGMMMTCWKRMWIQKKKKNSCFEEMFGGLDMPETALHAHARA